MAIAKEDIRPGWYWARTAAPRRQRLEIIHVRFLPNVKWWVTYHGTDSVDDVEVAVEEFDFIARIEPPEGM
jgi:hypothetical protein